MTTNVDQYIMRMKYNKQPMTDIYAYAKSNNYVGTFQMFLQYVAKLEQEEKHGK